MARITVEDCMAIVPNRFDLIILAAKRARQLANGVEPLVDNTLFKDKPTVLALREIAARHIDEELVDRVEKDEQERRDQLKIQWAVNEIAEDKTPDAE